MKFTDIFIRRPVLALVVSTLILLLGAFAFSKLPVRQYPMLQNSTITIVTDYPGASSELMQGLLPNPLHKRFPLLKVLIIFLHLQYKEKA